jgi:hypothetical protein
MKCKLLILSLLIIIITACQKTKDIYPITPVIAFKDFVRYNTTGYDDSLITTITFTDGDGDIGLRQEDTIPKYDFYTTVYQKQSGVFKALNLGTTTNYRMPYITPTGANKALKGTVSINFNFFPPHKANDTLRYDIFIIDRAFHKSNVITTPEVVVNTK